MPRRNTLAAAPRWQRRPDDRPKALMASALKLVKERGYRRVRLEDIAADAGVCKATVYHYFENKDALLTRTVEERVAERHAQIEQLMASAGGTASSRLRLLLGHFWEFSLTSHAGVWQRLMTSEIVTEAPAVFNAWGHGLVRRWHRVQKLIEEGQRDGEFRKDVDAAVAARLIVSGLAHQALFHVHFGLDRIDPCSVDRIFDAAVAQLFNSLHPVARTPTRRRR
jgi:AcrR family transcriptional regulator